jgi:hypothetical protein
MAASLHALIYPSAPNTIVERRVLDLAAVPAHKQAWWRPVVVIGNSSPDETQVKEGPVVVIEVDRVVETYTLRPKTAGELDVEKEAKLDAVDALQLKVSFDIENRVRVLEGKAPVTAQQYRAALKARI